MIKVLFLIHDLGQGGAEKVLVNLVNHMDRDKFDITVMTLFDHGENRGLLASHIRYRSWCGRMIHGNSHWMKLFSPRQLHRMIIKEHYDIEVAFLEGPSARVISGCEDPSTRLVSWFHIVQGSKRASSASFRSVREAERAYRRFSRIICVSDAVAEDVDRIWKFDRKPEVLYNVNDSAAIRRQAREDVAEYTLKAGEIKLVGVGKLLQNKGFDRIIRCVGRLVRDGVPLHLYLLGDGPERGKLLRLAQNLEISDRVTLLGYQMNPYRFMARCDLFVCASHAEGFSTAATEALILGLPVCTVDVAGMRELLEDTCGIVTENNEEALYRGLRELVCDRARLEQCTAQAAERGGKFSAEKTVSATEQMLLGLLESS